METAVQANFKLQEEIDSIQQYLKNEALRYQGKLSWDCSVDPDVDRMQPIPKMLILTFVENAITHSLFQNNGGGKVEVSVHKSNLGVLIMVTDNGAGLKESSALHQHQKEKLRSLDVDLKFFNKKQANNISYSILNRSLSETGRCGSRVLITIHH